MVTSKRDDAGHSVSVVIVNYETSDMVRRCVASLARQACNPEIIVVDNPSPAQDARNLEELDIVLVRNSENTGYGPGCNLGVREAHGSILCILNPDTALPDATLDRWLDILKREQRTGRQIGVLAPRLANDNGTIQRSTYDFPNVLNYWLYHSLLAGGLKQARKRLSLEPATGFKGIRRAGWVMGSAMMIPREAWEAVGGFGENYFLYAEDTDLCYRLAQAGFEILFTPEVTITHSQGEPPPEKRDVAALRLFNGIRTFLRQHYRPTRRRAVESCIVCDMLVRIGLFSIPGVGGPDSVLRRKRLEGYRKILRLYLKGSVDQ